MPTKPTDLPPAWADAGVYPLSNYPLLLPWGASNPLSGVTPWSAGARLDDTNLVAFASAGMTPQIPLAAEELNEWWRRVQIYINWVNLGTSADDGDAHVMETDGSGISSAQKYQATFGFCNAGVTSAIMLAGATIPNGEELSMSGSAKIAGNNGTEAELGAVNFLAGGAPPGATGLGVGGTGGAELFYGPASRVHHTTNGYVYATGDQEADTGNAATLQIAQTSVSVVALGAGNVRVIAVGQAQVNGLPNNFTINVQQKVGAGAWANIGAAQPVTAQKDTSDPNDWQPIRHERIFAAGFVNFTDYRLEIVAGGGSVRAKEVRLRVVSERG